MSIRDKFISQGYVVFPSLIEEATINTIRSNCLHILRKQIKNHKCHDLFDLFNKYPQVVKNCGKVMQGIPTLYSLAASREIIEAVEKVLEIAIIHTKPQIHFHHKRLAESEINYKTPAHQDSCSMQSSNNSIVVWIPMVDCINYEIGPLEVAPYSHSLGSQWQSIDGSFGVCDDWNDEDSAFKSLPCKVGDAIMFSSSLIHRSGDNVTEDQPRWSITLRYSDIAASDWIKRDYHNPYTYKPVMDENYSVSAEDMEIAFNDNN